MKLKHSLLAILIIGVSAVVGAQPVITQTTKPAVTAVKAPDRGPTIGALAQTLSPKKQEKYNELITLIVNDMQASLLKVNPRSGQHYEWFKWFYRQTSDSSRALIEEPLARIKIKGRTTDTKLPDDIQVICKVDLTKDILKALLEGFPLSQLSLDRVGETPLTPAARPCKLSDVRALTVLLTSASEMPQSEWDATKKMYGAEFNARIDGIQENHKLALSLIGEKVMPYRKYWAMRDEVAKAYQLLRVGVKDAKGKSEGLTKAEQAYTKILSTLQAMPDAQMGTVYAEGLAMTPEQKLKYEAVVRDVVDKLIPELREPYPSVKANLAWFKYHWENSLTQGVRDEILDISFVYTKTEAKPSYADVVSGLKIDNITSDILLNFVRALPTDSAKWTVDTEEYNKIPGVDKTVTPGTPESLALISEYLTTNTPSK